MVRDLTEAAACFWIGLVALGALTSCSVDNPKNHYVLAEKLWSDQKYSAAVVEFEKVVQRDPKGTLGLQALYRAAATQALFLSLYSDALRNYNAFIARSTDAASVWDAKLEVGDILFSKTEQYDQAIPHYQGLLRDYPKAVEAPEFQFRIAKSHYYLRQFEDAIFHFQKLMKLYPSSPLAERALYEVGLTLFTGAEQRGPDDLVKTPYEDARKAFERFAARYPQSRWVPEARFGIASCLQELDRLDEATQIYEEIKDRYPSPAVIDVKLARIRERKEQRTR